MLEGCEESCESEVDILAFHRRSLVVGSSGKTSLLRLMELRIRFQPSFLAINIRESQRLIFISYLVNRPERANHRRAVLIGG